MTALGSGAPDRESTSDAAPRRGIGRQIAILMAIGLVFRLILAYGIDGLRGSGFGADLGLFNYWADTLREFGPWGFYANASYADYTPGYLYALWPIGYLREIASGMGVAQDIVDSLIKLPAIITDVVMGYLVASMALELGVSRGRALAAAAVVILNPITWFDSVIWGQVDSFGTVFLMLGVRELWRGRMERAAVIAVIAALIKPQLAILVPIVAVVAIRRALWPKGGYGDEEAPRRRGFSWEFRDIGWKRIVTTAVAGFVTAVALSAPFGLTVIGVSTEAPYLTSTLLRLIFSTAATYPYLTVNAYNWWALFPVDGQSVATAGGALWMPDSPVKPGEAFGAIGPIPAALVGAALLLGTAAVVAWFVARKPDRLTILVGVSVLALAFFAAPTRVHERYLFPFFGLAGILFAISTRWKIAYVVAGAATFLNMYVVLVALYPDNPGVSDWLGIGDLIRSTIGVTVVSLVHSAAFIWGVLQLRPKARRTLAAELERARVEDPGDEPEEAAARGVSRRHAGGTAAGALAGAGAGAALATTAGSAGSGARAAVARLVPAWYDRPSWTETGPIAWLRARIGETPFRPDRSASLNRERRGRLDRLDLLLLIALVVAAMFLRTYRLADPARMHFDEVYHARTAAEFLQFWRYGISHNIYEWTHPHLAKYAMAGGIVAFAGHDVAEAGDLGVPVRDATVEPRREDLSGSGDRAGDRTWVATGAELIAYDQLTRRVEARWALPGAGAVAFDDVTTQLLVGTDGGELLAIDTTALDATRGSDPANPPIGPVTVATLDGAVDGLAGFRDGSHVAARLAGGTVAVVDLDTGEVSGTALVNEPTALSAVDDLNAVMVVPENATDPAAAAARLVDILGGDEEAYVAALSGTTPGPFPLPDVVPDIEERRLLKTAIDAAELPGIELQPTSTMAVGGADGVTFLDVAARPIATVELNGVGGMAPVTGVDDGSQLYVTTLDPTTARPEISIIAISGERADDGPEQMEDFALPAAGTEVVFDVAAEMLEVLGTTPDGTGSTVYIVEPHGRSVFADHELPFAPAALALDHNKDWPAVSHGTLLALGAGGEAASLDVGSYHFSWRLPGVILGALTVAVLFLLGRLLFSRRAVGVLVGLFVVLDGMFFVQSRIAMNDVYTAFFILAAYLLFAWMWLEPERVKRAFWVVMPAMGVLLGLALASKWVAAYAIGALGILVLIRSALGRMLLIVGMIGITAVLGWMALAVPVDSGGAGNLPFILIMIGLTLATVVVSVYHPVAWSDDEVRFAVGAPAAAGIVIALAAVALGRAQEAVVLGPFAVTPLEAGFGLVVVGIVAYAAFMIGGKLGVGPMAPLPDPDAPEGPPPASPAPEGWVRPGWGLGLPVIWLGASLLVIPIFVYVALYIPWAFMENHQLVTGWPVGHTGQTLAELTEAMYRYHNELTAAHAASSPWWAWPLNLKPVWFYQGSYAEGTSAAIYNAGNMVIWWMGIPAMFFVAYQAFRRRSLALALILIAFLAQWVSWARIDRASFQYHYYTSLPFVVLSLGYFVGEIWHGASKRTWLLVRASAAVAMMGPVILWLLRYPLCALADVESVNAGSQACNGNPGNLVVTPATAAMVVVAIVTVIVLVWQLVSLGRGRPDGRSATTRDLLPIVLTAGAGAVALVLSRLLPDADPLFTINGIVPEIIALIVAVPLGLIAIQILTARDARRFVGGLVAAAAAWFVLLYPNISALPMPSAIVNAYQGLLPTYLYPFQFGVSKVDRGAAISFSDPKFFLLVAFLVIASGIVAYSAWAWRQALAPGGRDGTGPGAGDVPDDGAAGDEAVGSGDATGPIGGPEPASAVGQGQVVP